MDLLTAKQAAKILGIHPDTIRTRIKRGQLKGTKMGRDWFFTREQLETKNPEPTQKLSICKHGIVLSIGICKHGCR